MCRRENEGGENALFVCEGDEKSDFFYIKIKTQMLMFYISRTAFSVYILPPGLSNVIKNEI